MEFSTSGITHVALVSEVGAEISASELARVTAALQKQVIRDMLPIWHVVATVNHFPSLDDVPIGYWPVIIRDDIGFQGAAGIHLDEDGQPFSLVQMSAGWSLTASHEVLEMLCDPFGNRVVASDSIKPGQGRVEYLVEVCDPSEAEPFSYRVNGQVVSDFYTPRFFDPLASPGTRYSFTNAIKAPRSVLRGGYLSWHDPATNHWFQATWFSGTKPVFRDLGVLTGAKSIRDAINAVTDVPIYQGKVKSKDRSFADAKLVASGIQTGGKSKADRWRRQIAELRRTHAPR
jgi:hypothetical protein